MRTACILRPIASRHASGDNPGMASSEPSASAPSQFRFGDCEIDLAGYELRRGDRACPIEPQVLELLIYLVTNPGRLVTKDELIAKVWGGRIVSDAALASRIKSARRAIGDDGEQQRFIRTVHGRGVRFVAEVTAGPCQQRDAAPVAIDAVPATAPDQPSAGQTIRFCTTSDGVRIAYASVGSGPPLVRPANWLSHLEFDWQSPVWRHWLRELSRDRRLIRYDERANGLSDWDAADVSFEALVRDLEAVVDAAGLDRFPMLCISQGCAIGAVYAVRHPERVSHLVLYGGYARGWAKRGSAEDIARRHALGTLIEHGWGQDNPAFRQVFTTMFVPDATAEQMRWFNELQRVTTSPANALRLHHSFGQIDVRAVLPQVRTPTLVLHGRNDGVVPFAEGCLLASLIPNAQFVALESRNHVLLENEPAWPRFLAEMRAFLAAE